MIRSRSNMASTQWFGPGAWRSAIRPDGKWNGNNGKINQFEYGNTTCDSAEGVAIEPEFKFDISRRFLQLAKLDNGGFERLNRYETALWRQVCQVIFTLDVLRRQNLDIKWLPRPTPPGPRFRFSHDRLSQNLEKAGCNGFSSLNSTFAIEYLLNMFGQ